MQDVNLQTEIAIRKDASPSNMVFTILGHDYLSLIL
jgi:hypothetical protein